MKMKEKMMKVKVVKKMKMMKNKMKNKFKMMKKMKLMKKKMKNKREIMKKNDVKEKQGMVSITPQSSPTSIIPIRWCSSAPGAPDYFPPFGTQQREADGSMVPHHEHSHGYFSLRLPGPKTPIKCPSCPPLVVPGASDPALQANRSPSPPCMLLPVLPGSQHHQIRGEVTTRVPIDMVDLFLAPQLSVALAFFLPFFGVGLLFLFWLFFGPSFLIFPLWLYSYPCFSFFWPLSCDQHLICSSLTSPLFWVT